MKKIVVLNNFIEAGPLCVFLIYARMIDLSDSYNWLGPYLASSMLAVAVSAFLLYQNIVLNRLFLGINVYFISGCLGLVAHWSWLNHLYGELRASGMLIWILLVGVWTLFLSRAGFIGIVVEDRWRTMQFSALLLVLTGITLGVSYYFTGNRILGEFIPFTALFMAQRYLRKRLASSP